MTKGLTQPMFLLSANRIARPGFRARPDADCEWHFTLIGNAPRQKQYKTKLLRGGRWKCSCPDNRNPCKHMHFITARVAGVGTFPVTVGGRRTFDALMMGRLAQLRPPPLPAAAAGGGALPLDAAADAAAAAARPRGAAEVESREALRRKYGEFTMTALRSQLRERGLSFAGRRKANLVKRLVDADVAAQVPAAAAAAAAADDDADPCAICFEDLPTAVGTRKELCETGPCGHVFHKLCIRRWIEHGAAGKNNCPTCRYEPWDLPPGHAEAVRAARARAMASTAHAGYDPLALLELD